jgi:hypothetical protein
MRFLSLFQSRCVNRADKPLFDEPICDAEGSASVLGIIMSKEMIGLGARKLYRGDLCGDARVEGSSDLRAHPLISCRFHRSYMACRLRPRCTAGSQRNGAVPHPLEGERERNVALRIRRRVEYDRTVKKAILLALFDSSASAEELGWLRARKNRASQC